MKAVKILVCTLLIAVMAFGGPVGALAEEAEQEAAAFPAADREMIENFTDSEKLPIRSELSEFYGQTKNEDADVIESMISDEAKAEFSASIDAAADFEPVKDEEVSLVLGRVENFLSSGGLKAYLENENLLMGSEIGLTRNREEKVKVLGSDSNASGWVFVVDKDAMSWWVTDSEGMGIPNALVTISYLDESGRRVTKSTPATAGNTPGIAVFDELPEYFFGLVDIQAQGYHAVSILDKKMGKGEHYTISLSEAKENEVYIRGVDLGGKDMVNEETRLSLVDVNTEDLPLKVIVTKTGNAQFPKSVELYSENRGENVLTISEAADYEFGSDTKVYTASRRWVERNAGLFRDSDLISVRFGETSFALEHLTVENAVSSPGFGETQVPVTTKNLNGNVSDRLGGSGFLNQTMQMLQVPVSFGVFPDGSMCLMATYDITQLDPNTQYKFSSLFEKSWNPKNTENLQEPLEIFQKSFWENTEKVKKGDKILESTRKIKMVSNFSYDFSISFSVFLRSNFNKETNDSYGTGGFLFSGGITAGVTEYFLLPAGPIVIPVYIGFEGHLYIKTAVNVNFGMDRAPTGHDQDAKWSYTTSDGTDVNGRIEVIVGFSVFGGVGVKGVLGAAAVGFVDFDIATVIGKGQREFGNAHSFIDVLYGLRIEYYLLFYSGTINLDCAQGAKRLADSDGEYDLLTEAIGEMEFTDLPLADCAERFVLQAPPDGGGETDEYYELQRPQDALEGSSEIVHVDVSVYPDPQIQFAATRDYTALFRIASNGVKTDIYYQLQNRESGNLYTGIYKVKLPEGETRSVSEFVVVPNKTNRDDPEFCNKVYLGAVLVDNTLADENERMRSTDVAAIVVDLEQQRTDSSVIASSPSDYGRYFYSAPMPAGREDYCSVVYAATVLSDENGNGVDGLRELLGAVSVRTNYWLSYGEEGKPEARSVYNLGSNKVYSTGVIAPNEPSYWTADPLKSSDKYLVLKGYGANGYYEETLRSNFRIDIDGMIDPKTIYDGTVSYDTIISNWQYLNGCSYFIAGDSVYWMKKNVKGGDPADYEWAPEKVKNGSGVISVDNRYAMITNNNQSAVYLIGVVGDYDVDVEEGTAVKGKNIAKIYTITTGKVNGVQVCTLHGPLDLKFASGEQIQCFAAAYNPDDCAASGLTVAYSTPANDQTSYACNIKMWKQNADRGMLVTQVRIPDYLILTGQPTISVYVTVRNYGYGRECPVSYLVYDENGTLLMQTNGKNDFSGDGYSYTGADLYTGDSRTDLIYIRPNPNWGKNKEHEVRIEVTGTYKYTGSLDDVVNFASMKADNVSLTAENTLIGGKHYISTSITNNTLVGISAPLVKLVPDYGEETGKGRTLQFSLPTDEMICRFDEDDADFTGQVYHFDVDMDGVWKDGAENGLLGFFVSLVDRDGNQVSNEVLYLANPAGKHASASVENGRSEQASKPQGTENAGNKAWILWAVLGAAGLAVLIAAFVLFKKRGKKSNGSAQK